MRTWTISRTLVTFGVVAMGVAAVACTERIYMGEVKADGGTPGFLDPNARDAAFVEGGGPRLECIGTECPEPWATCISEDGPTYKCGTDLQRDINHCGACGNKCAAGTPCINGACGCPAGQIACSGMCVDPQNNDNHCGACGIACSPPTDACSPMQPNTKYGCFQGQCGKKRCIDNAADCNGDLGQSTCGGDGCEVFGLNTKENCGGCGVKCAKPGEECVNEGNGWECAIPCERFGKVLCGDRCVDLLNDVGACGACSSTCKPSGPNQNGMCKKGVCTYECLPGFADCNGDSTDGCETNLNTHPVNCGACGNACNALVGQPCIEGQCLMTGCDAGVPR